MKSIKKTDEVQKDALVTRNTVADWLDMTPAYISHLASRGVLPASKEDGRYNLHECVIWYIRSIRKMGRGRKHEDRFALQAKMEQAGGGASDTDGGEDKNYKELIDIEKWRQLKRENDTAERVLVPSSEVGEAVAELVEELKPVLAALHITVKRACPEISPAGMEAIQRAVAKRINGFVDKMAEKE